MASTSRRTLDRISGGGKEPGEGRKQSKAKRSKSAASGRKRRFFDHPHAGKDKIHRWAPSWWLILDVFLLGALSTVGTFVWAHNTIKASKPSELVLVQSSAIYYADGTTEAKRFMKINW